MAFWLGVTVLIVLAVGALIAPLLRRRAENLDPRRYNSAVFKDQLAEIKRDVVRGVLAPAEAEAARTEVARRLLAADRLGAGGERVLTPRARLLMLAAIALAVPMAALALYARLGAPKTPDLPLAERSQEAPASADASAHPEMDELLVRLEERLRQSPDDPKGWALLGHSRFALAQYDAAAAAFAKAVALTQGTDTALLGAFAEARILSLNGFVDTEAKKALESVLAREAGNERAQYYMGLAEEQEGHREAALARWKKLLAGAPADAPWAEVVRRQVARLSEVPGREAPPVSAVRGPGTTDMSKEED